MAKKPPTKHLRGRRYKTPTGTNLIKLDPPKLTDAQFCLTHDTRLINNPDLKCYAFVAFDRDGTPYVGIYPPENIPKPVFIEACKTVLSTQSHAIDLSDM